MTSYKSLETKAARLFKKVVIRCPSSKGKKSNFDYYYRVIDGGNDEYLMIDSLEVPVMRLSTVDNKRTYHRFAKTDWTRVSGVYDVALLSPLDGELIGHAPFSMLGKWASPSKQPHPPPQAAKYNLKETTTTPGPSNTPKTTNRQSPLSQERIRKQLQDTFGGSDEDSDDEEGIKEAFMSPTKPTRSSPPNSPPLTATTRHEVPMINIIPATQETKEKEASNPTPSTAPPSHEEIETIDISEGSGENSGNPLEASEPSLETVAVPHKSPTRPTDFPAPLVRQEKSPVGIDVLVEQLQESELPPLNWITLMPPTDPPFRSLLDPRNVKIGKLMAELHNVREAKLRHIQELNDGRPPIIPMAKAFQCPSMGKVFSEYLVDEWNRCMLKCGEDMSIALIEAEEEAENSIRREILAEQGGILPTNIESHSIDLIMKSRLKTQKKYVPNEEPLVFFKLEDTGKQIRLVPHESGLKAHTSGHKIPGKAKGAKATKAEAEGAKATKANTKPGVPVSKNSRKRKNPKKKTTPAINPTPQEKQPAVPTTVKTPSTTQEANKGPKTTGGTHKTQTTTAAPKAGPSKEAGSRPTEKTAPTRPTGNSAQGPTAPSSKNGYQGRKNSNWQNNKKPGHSGGSYNLNWRSVPPLMDRPSYPYPPPNWGPPNWQTGWNNQWSDQGIRQQPYEGNAGQRWNEGGRNRY